MRSSKDLAGRALRAALVLVAASCTRESPTVTPLDAPSGADVVVSVSVSPALDSLDVGETVQLVASALDRNGGAVAADVSWSSATPAVAVVDGSGLVTALDQGSAVVMARAGGRSGTATLVVHDPRPPAAPSQLTVVPVSDRAVALAWTDDSDNEDAFVVERQPAPDVAPGPTASEEAAWVEVVVVDAGRTAARDTALAPATTYRYRVLARNENGDSEATEPAEATTYEVLGILTGALDDGTQNVPYEVTLEAEGGDGAFVWRVAAGGLPAGLSLSVDGVLDGTPGEVGDAAFTLEVSSGGQTLTRSYTLTVNERILPPEVESATLPDGAVGKAYAATLEASHGDGHYAWTLVSGALPDGLALALDGTVSGTPAAVGTSTFTVSVTSAEMGDTGVVSLTVHPALEVTSGSLEPGRVGAPYEATLEAAGGDGTYAWSLDGGHTPWLAVTPVGVLSGTPPVEGDVDVALTVVSGDGQSAHALLSLRVLGVLSIETSSLPDGELGVAYGATLSATGGSGDNAWAITSGALPGGLSLDAASGSISGMPTGVASTSFTVRASSSDGQADTAELQLSVGPGPVSIVTSALPSAQVGTPYLATLAASGGDGATYAWSLVAGSLPAGLSLSPGGSISGTPTAEGSSVVTVQAESGGRSGSRDLALSVSALPVEGYDIELVYLTALSATHEAAFESARTRWEHVIVADVEDEGPLSKCGTFHPATPGGVDDLAIYVTVDSIDGPFNTLGQAGPCYIRSNGLPITGAMTFDGADLDWLADHGQLVSTILHEMGHVLGIGTTWSRLDLLDGTCTEDPIFTGTGAVAAFDAAGGASYVEGGKVPVENQGSPGDGSNCAHWRESVLGRELMTPTLSGSGSNPLSLITIASLEDEGYVVDPAAASAYSLPAGGPSGVAGSGGPVLRLGNDVLPTPRYMVHPDGRIEQVAPGGATRKRRE